MNLLYSVFFGAGIAAFVYSRMGRRLGYSNTGNQVTLCLVVFVIASIIFFTIFTSLS